MTQPERYQYLVLCGGNGGGFLAWHLARLGRLEKGARSEARAELTLGACLTGS